MKSFWGIIPRYISKNKKRVIFIGLSIIISMSVIVSMSFIKGALKVSLYNKMVDDMGGIFDYMGQSSGTVDYESLKNEEEIQYVTLTKLLGKSKIPNTKYSIKISSYEENVTDLLNFKLNEGRYPKSGNEIAIEKWILDILPEKYKIGDTIKLDYSTIFTNKKGEFTTENNSQEFVIVGTFDYTFNQNMNFSQGIAYVNPEFVKSLLNESSTKITQETVYLTVKPGYSPTSAIKRIAADDKYKSISFIKNQTKVNYEKNNQKYDYILGIVFLIIAGISSIIIYNIFNVSVAERTKEFGMLRAVGCPPWKIKAMVICEGLIMAIVFIPIGIIVGTYATKGVLKFITGIGNLGGVSSIPKSVLLIAVAIGILMVIAGSYFPARKASKISYIEAISSNNNSSLKGSKLKIGLKQENFIGRKFNFEGNMAILNVARNKNRFITTCISIIVTATLFMTVNYIISSTNPIAVFKQGFDGDFKVMSKAWITKEKAEEIKNLEGIEKINTYKETYTSLEIDDKAKVTEEGISHIKELAEVNSSYDDYLKANKYIFPTPCISYKPEELENLKSHVVDGEIDLERMQKEPIVILAQNLNGYNDTKLKPGDSILLWCTKKDEAGNTQGSSIESFTIGAIVDDDAFKDLKVSTRNTIILSESVMETYMWIYGYQRINIFLDKHADYTQSEKLINEAIKNVKGAELSTFKDEIKQVETQNKQIVFAMYAVVIVVAIVSIINLINIMSMNAIVRKQEFGCMRAMGLSKAQVKKIIRMEGLIYGTVSGTISVVLGLIISIILASKSRVLFGQEIIWSLPLTEMIITFVVVVIITTLAAILTSRMLYKDNIVENIRSID